MTGRGRWAAVTAALLLLATVARPAAAQAGATAELAVGSKNFTESRLLAEIMAQLLEERLAIPVERRVNLGGTMLVFAALRSGEIDLYPEYTGTGWAVVLEKQERAGDPLRTFMTVRREYQRRFGLTWLDPFGFSNSYGVALREEVAAELGITRISELAVHGDRLRSGWSHEFLNREDGFPGLAAAYGLELAEVRGMEHGLAYEALRSGQVDLTDAYTTDGKLLRFPVRLLEDDRRFFPPYDCAPVVREETLERHPGLAAALSELAFRLPAERMQRLNYQVEEEGKAFEEVARTFLQGEGLLTGEGALKPSGTDRAGSLGDFVVARLPATAELVAEHLALTVVAVLLAILVALPLGIWLHRRPRWSGGVLNAVGVIQTVPSLALLAFMIPILGLGARAAITALFLYALLPILRNTYTGLREVDPELVEAARGMGLSRGQVLRRIELPLSLRTLMAGIRTSAVISIGVATLAAFIGAGGLGDPILTGLQLNDTRLILAGAVPAALLAILTDVGLGHLERALTPRGLRGLR